MHVYTQGVHTSIMAKTVPFTFRINIEDKASLVEMALLYGSPTPGAFLNEMCHCILSGDQRNAAQFLQRLIMKSGEQLALQLEAQVEAHVGKVKATKRARLTKARAVNAKKS